VKNDTAESRKQSDAVERLTGERYCHSSGHWTKAPTTVLRKGRRICDPCRARLDALSKKKQAR
jgi:hypothetical protein